MEDVSSDFSWFVAYLIIGILLATGVAACVMVWIRRKRRQERREASKASRAKLRAWRAGQ